MATPAPKIHDQAPMDHAPLRRLIARRKMADAMFAMLGLLLVVASLSVLVVLFGQLLRDGAGRLGSHHEVKPGGYPPGRFDIVGELVKRDTLDGAATWALKRDELHITNADKLETDLAGLEGKSVIVDGDIPSP